MDQETPIDVFVYGETGADNLIQVPYLPTPERAACILSESYHVGGVGANVAVLLSAWGLRVRLSGNALGDDDYGQLVRAGLEAYPSLDLTYFETHPGIRTPFWRIMVTPDGERTQLYGFGDLSMTPLRAEMLGGSRFLALDLYGGPEREEAARLAHAAGLTVVTGDILQPEHPLLPITDIAANSASLTRGEYPGLDPFEHARRLHADLGRDHPDHRRGRPGPGHRPRRAGILGQAAADPGSGRHRRRGRLQSRGDLRAVARLGPGAGGGLGGVRRLAEHALRGRHQPPANPGRGRGIGRAGAGQPKPLTR